MKENNQPGAPPNLVPCIPVDLLTILDLLLYDNGFQYIYIYIFIGGRLLWLK